MIDTNPFIYATDTIAGVDYSLRSTAICVIPSNPIANTIVPFASCEFYYLTDVRKDVVDEGNIHGTLIGDWDTPEERYESIAEWSLGVLQKHKCMSIGIEDYAFRAANQSSLTQLAESTGLLKWMLHSNGIPYTKYSISKIKKFATSNGRSLKVQMYDAWIKDQGICLNSAFNRDPDVKPRSPVSDLVDAFYTACIHRIESCAMNYHYRKEKE